MRRFLDRIEEWWCVHRHAAVMWPIRGHYQCRVCLRQYRVAFEAAVDTSAASGYRDVPGMSTRVLKSVFPAVM